MGSSFSEVCLANSIDLPARLSPIAITSGLVEYNLYKPGGGWGEGGGSFQSKGYFYANKISLENEPSL